MPGGALGATRIVRCLRQGRIRLRFARRIEVEQQRQDRMRIGRHRQFHLTALVQAAIARQYAYQQLADQLQQHATMLRRVIAFALDEGCDPQVAALDGLTQPRDVKPHSEIAQVLIRGVADVFRRRKMRRQRGERRVSRIAVDQVGAMGAQAGTQQLQSWQRRLRQRHC